jgi:tetratricopeptide (TPR) repeat protein
MPSVRFAAFALTMAMMASARGQDMVIAASATDPAARIKKAGQIIDFTGTELTLKTTFGTTDVIPANRVVEIQTKWTRAHGAARTARIAGNLEEAIAAFRRAKGEESRLWARRQVAAELAGCYLEAGRIDSAGDEFLAVVASDPATPHYDCIPVAWRAAPPDRLLESRATAWLAMEANPAARLLGASWLLSGAQRPAATAALEGLSADSEPRIAGLATIQLWRTKLVTAKEEEIRRWLAQLERMPTEIQASGWYVLGDLLSRQEQPQQAALAYLKVPLLFPEQRAMAADALLAAGKELDKLSQTEQAAGLYRELARDFAHLPAAAEAQSRLAKSSAAP